MKVAIFGLGYVGLTMATCIAKRDAKVIGCDVDTEKVRKINKGETPIHEPELPTLLKRNVKERRLSATEDARKAVKKSQIIFITVGTPNHTDGSINLDYVRSVSETIGKELKDLEDYKLVVLRSTVTPGTTYNLVKPALETTSNRICGKDFGLVYNPEFLSEGSAIKNTLNPDRIIIGEIDKKSGKALEKFYRWLHHKKLPPIIRTNPNTAELIKYTNNAFLAMKVSFINQIANLCQRIPNTDVEVIAKGIGLDERIAPLFLKAGFGWGGSCFLKDLKALSKFSRSKGVALPLTEATLFVNEIQPLNAVNIAEKLLGDIQSMRIAILGLSFKPGTDDIREAVSIKIVKELLRREAKIVAYDPAAIENVRKIFGNRIEYSKSALECINSADCSIIVTEWSEFSKIKPEDFISRMRNPIVIDGRRIYEPEEFSSKLRYIAIGLGSKDIQLERDESIWINPALAVNVIVEDGGEVMLVRRNCEPFKRLWSLPGGYVEYGETVENAAKREVKEESGLDIELSRIIGIYSDSYRHPWKHVIAICYLAHTDKGEINTEFQDVKFFILSKIPENLAFDHVTMLRDYIRGNP
ncbi:MAG: nucleotide sugar dehydrogenase [Candidatus Methylarchaceae archaeon HK02M2]|nr:nucleotide sugar dehydrogenase [Candidatus Methylarchaceae archaeon HK02M2]